MLWGCFAHILFPDTRRSSRYPYNTHSKFVKHLRDIMQSQLYILIILLRYPSASWVPGKVVEDKRLEMQLPVHKHQCVDVPNGETYLECRKRAAKYFSEVLKVIDESDDNAEENILAISHGILLTCLLENIIENPAVYELVNFNEDQINERVLNTGRTRFSLSKLKPGAAEKRVVTFTHFFDTEHYKHMDTL